MLTGKIERDGYPVGEWSIKRGGKVTDEETVYAYNCSVMYTSPAGAVQRKIFQHQHDEIDGEFTLVVDVLNDADYWFEMSKGS